MTTPPSKKWAYCLRPLWMGTGIGILSFLLLEVYFRRVYRSDQEIDFREMYRALFRDRYWYWNWYSFSFVPVLWGFVLGLLASVDRIARTWKK